MIRVDGREARTAEEFRELYGAKVREQFGEIDDYNLELKLFRELPIGADFKADFCLSSMQMQWGDWLQLQNGRYENYWFKRIIRAACRHRWICLVGSASSGKSFGCAAYLHQAWKVNPWQYSAIVSSTSGDALEQRAWGIMKEMHSRDKYPVGTRLDYKDAIVFEQEKNSKERFFKNSITAVALPKGSEGEAAIGEIQGRKNEMVGWLCDEFGHMDGNAVTTATGNLAANPSFQFFACSNKPEQGDAMYQEAEPAGEGFEAGWDTPGLIDRTWWPTKMGICLYFDGDKCPNMEAPDGEPPPFPKLATREYRDRLLKRDGIEDGPQIWRWWRAFPKSGEIQDRVVTPAILEAFGATNPITWAGNNYRTAAGLDLGMREDGDPCVAAFAKVGDEYEGEKVAAFESETVQLSHSLSDQTPYDQQVARRFIDECEKRQCHIVAADISGGGGLMTQAIAQEARDRSWELELVPIDFGGSPSDEMYDVGGETKPARQLFDRRVTEIWYSFRLAIQNRKIRSLRKDSKGVKQLCARKVLQDEKRRWKIEKKRDMKKRIKRSPDDADAICLCHMAARKAGLSKDVSIVEAPRQPVTIHMPDEDGERRRYRQQHYSGSRYARR